MRKLDENLWLLTYPLKLLGADLRRNCCVIRLRSGEFVIHSMGPFTPEDVAAIEAVGQPGWLVEAMMRHDTFSKCGREAFPEIPFLAPPGFEESGEIDFPTQPILPTPATWGDELVALEIEGVPSMRETLFFHRPSRTLIVCDLVFNFGKDEPVWTEVLLWAAVGGEHHPGMSRAFKLAIKDEARFKDSMAATMAWDFDRVVVGHGDVIESGGKEKIGAMLRGAGF